MYMDILEQEVEDLGAEVMRLRLMMQRMSQVMEASVPWPYQCRSHVDPVYATSPPPVNGAGTPVELQATLELCKQMLPLLQLLLAQQRSDAEASHDRRRREALRHRRRTRKSHCRAASCSMCSSTLCSSRSETSSRRHSHKPAAVALPITSSPSQGKTPTSRRLPHKDASQRSASPSSAQKPIVAKEDGQERGARPAAAHVVGETPVGTHRRASAVPTCETSMREEPLPASTEALTTISTSVVNRLRAQRQRDMASERESSSGSSNAIQRDKSQTLSVTTSPSTSAPRRKCAAHVSTVTGTQREAAQAMKSAATTSQRRAAVSPAGEMGYYSSLTDHLASQASRAVLESPAHSKNSFMDAVGVPHGSVANSIIHSEQGVYSYSALPSTCDSPALSHVLEDAMTTTRAAQSTTTPLRPPPAIASPVQQRRKLLPLQTSALSNAEENTSSTSGSSVKSSEECATEGPSALQAVMPTPHRSGVILGGRQPISVQSMTSPSASILTGTSVRGARSAQTAAAVPDRGGDANAMPQMNLLPSLRLIPSGSSGSTSTSSDNTAFLHRPPRQATAAYHRDSSFHSCSDTEASRPPSQELGSRSTPQPFPDPHASRSHDAYSFPSYSIQCSAQQSPRHQEVDASSNSSRALSNSASARRSAQNASLAASAVSFHGSMATGGYYYGYNFFMGSSSQQSTSSSPMPEA
ncbi:hypothetical protein LSCM1_00607 [Leishmania martiniquensis]|uniref:Uncharacterized protein n=1 Tax=Leishmania martiniquensis TaxID=1580590 RepID=A0A836K8W7_9TRYP|nr:hypothetical protein LSCM1_00607 [Leishmania martiniquensis]